MSNGTVATETVTLVTTRTTIRQPTPRRRHVIDSIKTGLGETQEDKTKTQSVDNSMRVGKIKKEIKNYRGAERILLQKF